MQKRELSSNKFPRLQANDTTLSSKLYSLTGLRIFQAKFMEDLKHPRPPQKTMQNCNNNENNPPQIIIVKSTSTSQDYFTGKDKLNSKIGQLKLSKQLEKKEEKNIVNIVSNQKNVKFKLKCGRPRGLRNLGNTCYMNAILQSIFSLEQFNTALDKQHQHKKYEKKSITSQYLKLLKVLKNSNERDVLNPSEFKNYLGRRNNRFEGNSQQDSQQFLTAFLEAINEEMSRIQTKPKYQQLKGDPTLQPISKIADNWWNYHKLRDDSVVCDYFQGQFQSTIICSDCGNRSISFDNFWGMPISIGKNNSSLQDLLLTSLKTDNRLEGYSCGKCKKQSKCSKINKLFRLPQILIIQLKRFGYGWSKKQKIKDKVEVPLVLNMKEMLSQHSFLENTNYRLKNTVQHSGQLNYGHYTGHVFSQKDEKWYLANDEIIANEQVQLDNAKLYLLFYSKQ